MVSLQIRYEKTMEDGLQKKVTEQYVVDTLNEELAGMLGVSIRTVTRKAKELGLLCMRWSKYWGFSFSITPSKEHPGLISFRMDWLYLLAVQGTLKSLLQHHSSKASILRHSAFFTVQLSQNQP